MNLKRRHSQSTPSRFPGTWYRHALLGMSLMVTFFGLCAPTASSTEIPLPFIRESFSGDLPDLKKRRVVRALVVFGPTDFFFNKGNPSGIQVDLLKEYEKHLNKSTKRESEKIHVVFIPVSFDRLIPDLLAGKGDIAAHFLTETSKRKKKLLFASGRKMEVNELVVAHKDQTLSEHIDGLAGRKMYVLPGSSYLEHLQQMNRYFKGRGLKPIDVQTVDSHLSGEDILEMVNAGVIGMTVIDDYKARLWSQVLPDIRVQENPAVSQGNYLGWAVRKSNPKLAADLGVFWKKVQKGSLMGNILIKRYYKSTRWIKNPGREQSRKKFMHLLELFRKYGDKYGFD
ncbi:MAG: transporter substrate-binding domain-containing protein, partial [Thermodesulfobacteriota bacterium]